MTEGQPPVPIQPLPVFSPPPPPPSITPAPTFESHGIEGDRRYCHGCKAEIFWGVEHVCPVLTAFRKELADAKLQIDAMCLVVATARNEFDRHSRDEPKVICRCSFCDAYRAYIEKKDGA